MKAKQFLLSVFIFLLFLFSFYIILFYFQIGAPTRAEWWVYNSYLYKDYRSGNIKQKKIIIISGSNSLFGINSEVIEKITHYPVVNLATHGGLDIDYFYYKIKQQMNDGDIVVLPLEFQFYKRPDRISDWFTRNMMAWGGGYLKQLEILDLVIFFITAEPSDIFEGVKKKIKGTDSKKKNMNQKEVLKQLNVLWSNGAPKWRGYKFTSLNRFGDINVNEPVSYTKESSYGLRTGIRISSRFISVYKKIDKLIKRHHGTLYLTYPVTIRNKRFDLSSKETKKLIENLNFKLNKYNINIQCNAALFNLDRMFFFDTEHHPNIYGAQIRSENLAHCLNKLINNDFQKMSYHEAINQTNLLQQGLMAKVKKLLP
jgi:hypothetical protein